MGGIVPREPAFAKGSLQVRATRKGNRSAIGALTLIVAAIHAHGWTTGCPLVWADDVSELKSQMQEMREEIKVLRQEVQTLRAGRGGGGDAQVGTQLPAGEQAAPSAAVLHLPSGLKDVQFSGFVDTSYTYNFNGPNNRANAFRVFDTRAQDFMINNVELVVEKPVSSEDPLGFRTDLQFGSDPEVTGAVTTGLGRGDDELDIQQAFVEYVAPLGNGLDVKFGKFVTLHGAESTESKDNWNFSRSYLFGFAEPATHTGVRASYAWGDWLTTTVGVNNGWDVVDDTNKGKTLELSASITPMKSLSFSGTYMAGPEQVGDRHNERHSITFVTQYQPLDRLTLKASVDYALEQDALSEAGGGNASWSGLAAYVKYVLTDWWSVAIRFEVFNDQDGVRTGVNAGTTSPTGSALADLQLFEWTLTNEFRLNKHLLTRVEYRYDKASDHVLRYGQGFSDYQNTIAVEVVAPF